MKKVFVTGAANVAIEAVAKTRQTTIDMGFKDDDCLKEAREQHQFIRILAS